ncbi:MAG: hypothetical protein HZB41_04125 [Ignavibacteriae bacterium]|nr:hypothetical protein [Ignavibacteriota bacterium]
MKKLFSASLLIKILFIFIIVIFSSSICLAEESGKESKPFEPILTEETLPNEVGEWDLRFNIDYSRYDDEIDVTLPHLLLFFGILEDIGTEVSIPFLYRKKSNVEYGIGSISSSIKWKILEQSNWLPGIVLGVELGLPTNSFIEETEEKAWGISPYIAFIKKISDFSIQGNISRSVELPVSGNEKIYSTNLNLALIYPVIDESLYLLGELNSSWLAYQINETWIAPGIKYFLRNEDCIAFAVPIGTGNLSSVFRFIFQYQLQL